MDAQGRRAGIPGGWRWLQATEAESLGGTQTGPPSFCQAHIRGLAKEIRKNLTNR